MPETIKASEQNLDKVFCDDYLFEIPFYQRPYAWTTEEVGELLDDLLFAMDKDAEALYFLGSIVLIKGDSPDSKVIDGQQRLTTLTMLLCTMRELAESKEVKDALDERVRQKRDVLSGASEVVRLRLRPRDQDFFHANVQNDGGVPKMIENTTPQSTDSQERIYENAKFLHGKLEKLGQERLTRLAKFVIQSCYLVTVSTTDMSSAYRIFSVMNDRGLALEPTDILKAEIVGEIETSQQQEYSDKWENIEQELGRDHFGDLFAHIRMIFAKAKARSNLQDEFRKFVLKEYTEAAFIDRTLEPYADAYERVLGISDEYPADAGKFGAYLGHLRRLDNRDWIPRQWRFFIATRTTRNRSPASSKTWKGWHTACSSGAPTSMSGSAATPGYSRLLSGAIRCGWMAARSSWALAKRRPYYGRWTGRCTACRAFRSRCCCVWMVWWPGQRRVTTVPSSQSNTCSRKTRPAIPSGGSGFLMTRSGNFGRTVWRTWRCCPGGKIPALQIGILSAKRMSILQVGTSLPLR